MPPEVKGLPFEEAIKYFQDKVKLPTKKWTDLQKGMHTRAFTVAGATKTDLLTDFYGAVQKGLTEGVTLQDFQKDFDKIVEQHGWDYKGGRGWRTGVIFNTNMSTAYMAGRHKQMTDPDVLKARPYWMYDAVNDNRTRPEHKAWDGLVLPADDPWWDSHYPPNGWGCRCSVRAASEKDLSRMGKSVGKAPDDGHYEWTDPSTGEVKQVPKGVDPGWDYNVGESAWGKNLSDETMAAWRAQGAKAYERLTPGNFSTYNRPERIPLDNPMSSIDTTIQQDSRSAERKLIEVLGSREKVYTFEADSFRYDVMVNAESLANHIDVNRSPYIPFLPETLTDPYEVWLSFERHKGTGKVFLRQRIIKAIETQDKKGMLIVTNVVGGKMEAWTFIPIKNLSYLENQRVGKLIWKRD